MNEFEEELVAWQQAKEAPKEVKPWSPPPRPPKIELSRNQKALVIDYIMCAGKGIFEDIPEFWENHTEDDYEALRYAVDDFVEEAKHHLLSAIGLA